MWLYVATFLLGMAIGVAVGAYWIWKLSDKALKNQDKQMLRATSYYEVANQWVKNLHDGHEVKDFFIEKGFQSIAIYGYADLGKRMYEELNPEKNTGIEVAYIIDQNAGRVASDIDVYKPSDKLPQVDVIVVTPVHIYVQIAKMLTGMVPYKIISLEEVIYDT